MTCNHCAKASEKAARKAGAPEVEATWAENRAHPQFCPTCHGFLRADGGCTKCENAPVPTLAAAMAAPSPTLASAVASASAVGETVTMDAHWRNEFSSPKRGGKPGIVLRNGDTLDGGTRFREDDYCVSLGKARQQSTVGNFLTPAVDQLGDHEVRDGIVIAELSDGGVGYYDPETMSACCAGNCDDSRRGMCHHQMAAIVAGEMTRPPTDAEHHEIQRQLHNQFIHPLANPASTAEVMRRSDAAYVLLKEQLGEVRVNADEVKDVAEAGKLKPKPEPKKKRQVRKKRTPKDDKPALSGNGNPQVNAVMQDVGVRPPVPTVSEMQAQDPTLAGYQGFPVPIPDPRYEVGEQERNRLNQVMRRVNMSWTAARRRAEAQGGDANDPAAYSASMEDRCWGLYGPPGTGKNAMAKEVAASLGLGYMEMDVRDRSDFQTLLCDTVIESDGQGGTSSKVKLGPIGHALTSGNVVAINEIVAADPDAQTALHQVLQDGVIRAPGPEGATNSWKVHPNSMVFLTWNPNTTRADKPAPALLSRTPSLEMDYPPPGDEAKRLSRTMSDYLGQDVATQDVKRCVNLVRGLRELHERGELETCPTYREMVSFTKSYFLNGEDRHKAGEIFKVLCSKAPGTKDDVWKQVSNLIDSFQGGSWRV